MKQSFSKVDARKKISRNFQDARQLLKQRKHIPKTSLAQDARFKIRAKKFQPLKREMMKIKSATSNKTSRSTALPGRTIMNKEAAIRSNRASRARIEPINDPSAMSGFISLKGGKRQLLEKVTMHRSGMKIAVRNELALPTEGSRPTATLRKHEQPLKITLNNPEAARKLSQPYESYKPHTARQSVPIERQRRRRENHPYVVHNRGPVSPTPSRSSSNSYPSSSGFSRHMPAQRMSPLRPMTSKQALLMPGNSRYDSPREQNITPRLENFSPLEGTKILVSNLHPVVVEDDILELFSVVGPVRRARMVGLGKAEIVFIKREDAVIAYQKYNNRDLDGQPMIMKLLLHDENHQNQVSYSWMNDIGRRKARGTLEIDPNVLQRSLFKTNSAGPVSSPVVFTVKI